MRRVAPGIEQLPAEPGTGSAVPVADSPPPVSAADRGRQRLAQLLETRRAPYRSSTRYTPRCSAQRTRRSRHPSGLKMRDDLFAKETNGVQHLLVRCRPD